MSDQVSTELLQIFQAEASETIDLLVETIVRMRYGTSSDIPADIGLAFRLAHNLKGAARSVGFARVDKLAHTVEDLFSPCRDSGTVPDEKTFEKIITHIQKIEAVLYGKQEDESNVAIGSEGVNVAETPTREKTDTAADHFVRITTRRLSDLSNRADDMVTILGKQKARSMFVRQTLRDLQDYVQSLPGEMRGECVDIVARLEQFERRDRVEVRQYAQLVDNFRSAMVTARMQPLASQSAAWRRIARDVASTAKKQVRLSIQVDNIELDKHVLDTLRDPMVHLIRNAVDHGIEGSNIRKKQHKNAEGTISILARITGARIEIDVIDDGQGFDVSQIEEACKAKGLYTAEYLSSLSPEEKLDLVFVAGLTTAKSVSDISGRGVGLDVVRSSLEAIGGSATIITDENLQPGKGVRLLVPVSILTSRGVLVYCNNVAYLIPSMQIENTIRVATKTIQRVDGIDSVTLEEQPPLPLYSLGRLLNRSSGNSDETKFLNVIVFRDRNGVRGFVVDRIDKVDDFVIKAVPAILPNIPGVNGVAILGDGSLAIELDLSGIVSLAENTQETLQISAHKSSKVRVHKVLVVDDSLTSRTLERNILVAAGYEVVVAEDGEDAWNILQTDTFSVIVSDVEMPHMNGIELTRKIRQNKKTTSLPVILVTSLSSEQDKKQGAEVGANAYIVKSRFEQKILLEEVAKYG